MSRRPSDLKNRDGDMIAEAIDNRPPSVRIREREIFDPVLIEALSSFLLKAADWIREYEKVQRKKALLAEKRRKAKIKAKFAKPFTRRKIL